MWTRLKVEHQVQPGSKRHMSAGICFSGSMCGLAMPSVRSSRYSLCPFAGLTEICRRTDYSVNVVLERIISDFASDAPPIECSRTWPILRPNRVNGFA